MASYELVHLNTFQPLLTLRPASTVSVADAQLWSVSVGRLADFLIEGFVVCFFIGLLTMAALHLLRPLMRKTAQTVSLLANAKLPNDLMKRFGAEDDGPRYLSLTSVLVLVYGALPPWLANVKAWTPKDREAWVKARIRQREASDWGDRPTSVRWLYQFIEARRRGFAMGSTYLPDELFMRTIENEAKAVLARPSENPFLFALLTASAPDDATAVAGWIDALGEKVPADAERFSNPDGGEPGVAAGITAAQNAVVAAAESWLDKFQLSLASQSLLVSRLFAILAGISLTMLAVRFVHWEGQYDLSLGLGAAGGLLGLLANDALSAFAPGSRR